MCLGIPGKIVEITDEENLMGLVDVGGVQRETNLSCVINPPEPLNKLLGKWVLVHVGFAMSVIDEEEAIKTLSILKEMGSLQSEQEEIINYSYAANESGEK